MDSNHVDVPGAGAAGAVVVAAGAAVSVGFSSFFGVFLAKRPLTFALSSAIAFGAISTI